MYTCISKLHCHNNMSNDPCCQFCSTLTTLSMLNKFMSNISIPTTLPRCVPNDTY